MFIDRFESTGLCNDTFDRVRKTNIWSTTSALFTVRQFDYIDIHLNVTLGGDYCTQVAEEAAGDGYAAPLSCSVIDWVVRCCSRNGIHLHLNIWAR